MEKWKQIRAKKNKYSQRKTVRLTWLAALFHFKRTFELDITSSTYWMRSEQGQQETKDSSQSISYYQLQIKSSGCRCRLPTVVGTSGLLDGGYGATDSGHDWYGGADGGGGGGGGGS
ncbi:hypothetical protein F0562_007339 [Nyssa sinensis]|uniref:Uncharacterized protein n=1 Tax=Nyssa sinensis TaxID=561372 RepID=A0A5J5A5L2_9ASTE|nr:hypothetical protein F0562_007339 [Nyssa sinensis]